MIKHEIIGNKLHLYVQGMDKVWAFKSKFCIPLNHITSIRVDSDIIKSGPGGFRMPGTAIPNVITAGTYYVNGKRVFWDIHRPDKAVVLSLTNEKYSELVIEVENPELFVKAIISQNLLG